MKEPPNILDVKPTGEGLAGKVQRLAKKQFLNYAFGYGIVNYASLNSAKCASNKSDALRGVCTTYFHQFEPYKGGDVSDVRTAIAYAVSKKSTKSARKEREAAVQTAAKTFGSATGFSAGTLAGPGVGSLGGLVLGQITLSTVVSVGKQLKQKAKAAMKKTRGTHGNHRKDAAHVLVQAALQAGSNTMTYKVEDQPPHTFNIGAKPEQVAAWDTIQILMDYATSEEVDLLLKKDTEDVVKAVAAKMKSV